MHKFLIATFLAIFAVASIPLPTEAMVSTIRAEGWHMLVTDQKRATATLIDRSPRVTAVVIGLQKKAGQTKCRADVTVTKKRQTWRWRNLSSKETRIDVRKWKLFPRVYDRTIDVQVQTNGHCIVSVGVR